MESTRSDYCIYIRIPFKSLDDVSAKIESSKILNLISKLLPKSTKIKLQRVYEDKSPRLVKDYSELNT